MVLAHQGGWDELLLVAVPIAVLTGLLLLANRRAERLAQARSAPTPPAESTREPPATRE